MINLRTHFLRQLRRGDTLVEVMFAVGIFGLVAIGAVSVMNRGLYTAQGTLETTMARNEMDTQAEALRFIHDAYASKKKSASNTYSELWNLIRSEDYSYEGGDATDMTILNKYLQIYDTVAQGGGEIDGEWYETCGDLYSAIPDRSFVINPSVLDEKTLQDAIETGGLANVLLSSNSSVSATQSLTETPTFPRLFYGTTDAELSDATEEGTKTLSLQEAQGIWVTAVASGTKSKVESEGCGGEPDYYDFYIRTCWDTPGSNHPRTISTNVRLYNSDQVSLALNRQITFDNSDWFYYNRRSDLDTLIPQEDDNSLRSGGHVTKKEDDLTFSGYPVPGMDEGLYFNVETGAGFSIELDLDTTAIDTHPGGFFKIQLGAIYAQFYGDGGVITFRNDIATEIPHELNSSGSLPFNDFRQTFCNYFGCTYVNQITPPFSGMPEKYASLSAAQKAEIETKIGGEIIAMTGSKIHLMFEYSKGTYSVYVGEYGSEDTGTLVAKRVSSIPAASIRAAYGLVHMSHNCSMIAKAHITNITMKYESSASPSYSKCKAEDTYNIWYYRNQSPEDGAVRIFKGTIGQPAAIADGTIVNNIGHSFVSWNTKRDGTGTDYHSGDSVTDPVNANGIFELYAQWDDMGYTVAYDANGGNGTMANSNPSPSSDFTLRKNTFTREDYVFVGWSLEPGESTVVYEDKGTILAGTYVAEQVVTLYAQWKPVEYTVSYDLNGGTGTIPAPQKVDSGSSIKLIGSDGLSREDYHFVGWALGSPSGKAYSAGDSYTVKSSVTFYARWTPNTYMIQFVGQGGATNDGKTITTQEFQSGVAEKLDANPFIRDGYEFAGWSLKESSTEVAYSDGESITRSEKRDSIVTLYAVWRAEYTVSYNLNGGTGTVPASKVVAHGDTIQIASGAGLSKNYNHFGGWLLGAKGYSALANYIVTSDVTFYANWIPDAYAVQLNGNGGQTKDGQIIDAQMGFQSNVPKALKKNPFERAGYEFVGWGLSSTDTTKTYSDQETITRVEKEGTIVQLYAIWAIAPKTYRLSYDANGGSGAPSIQSTTNTAGSATFTVSSTVPTKSDHIFQGWSTSADAKSVTHKGGNSITITKDTTLYAVWEKKPTPVSYTVTYDSNGGTGTLPATSSYSAGTTITLSNGSSLTRQYYHLVGWTLNSTSGTSYSKGASYTVNSNVTFYAKWEHDNYQVTYKRNCGSSDTTNEVKNHNVGSPFSIISKPSAWSCSGKDFSGWATSASGSASSTYAPGKSFTPTSADSLTLYAVWTTPVTYTTYTLKYDANGGSGAPSNQTDTTTNDHGTFVISSVIPTRSGYTFRGWSDDKNATDPKVVGGNTATTRAAVVTIYAVWKQNTTTTPPSNTSTGCGSGWKEWTTGLCWQTTDAAKYVNHTNAENTCSSKGYRLPTMSEYNQLIKNYCSEKYLRGTFYCDASSPLAQNFNFNGLVITTATLSGTHGFYWMSNNDDIFAVMKNSDSEGLTSATTHGKNLFVGGSVSIVRASVRCVRNK